MAAVVNHDGSYKCDVLTQEGKIVKVGSITAEDLPPGCREIDATGRFVIPGGIDTHTHLEMPFMGTTTVDDYRAFFFFFLGQKTPVTSPEKVDSPPP